MNVEQLKYAIIEKLIRTEDEQLLERIAELMRSEPLPYAENDLQPMTVEELNERLRKAEDDIANGRVYSSEAAKKKLGL